MKKKLFTSSLFSFLLLGALLLTSSGLKAALGGIYTIDSSQAASSSNYRDFLSALSDLRLGTRTDGGTPNGAGVNAAVVFNVAAGTYPGQLDITGITGVSATNTITFDGGSGNASTRIVSFSATALATAYTIRINNIQWIQLRNLTIRATGASFGWPLHIMNTSSNVKVKNCIINFSTAFSAHTNTNFCGLVFNNSTASPTSSGSAAINVEVDSNFISGGYGNYMIGTASNTGIFFRNNVVDSANYYGIYMQSIAQMRLNKNTLTMFSAGNINSAGIYINSCAPSAGNYHEVNANKTANTAYYGIYIGSTNGQSSPRCQLFNNAIGGGFRNINSNGIYLAGYSWDVFNNSVNLDNVATGASAAAFYFGSCCNTGATLLDVRNNIFAVTATGSSAYTFYYPSVGSFQYVVTTTAALNYNIYYKAGVTSAQPILYYGGNLLSGSNLIGNGGYNTNSVVADPGFTGRYDLTPLSPCNNGANITAVTADINGTIRNNPPDIGAYEVSPLSNDVGVERITGPALPFVAGSQNITVTLRNYGSNAITSANVSYSVNGNTPVSVPFSGNIAPCGTATFTFGGANQFTFNANTAYQIKVFTDNPNGSADSKTINDTATVPVIFSGLSGNYTIDQGSPASSTNFPSFNAAATALNNGGVIGPVYFTVVGTVPYVEQVKLVYVPGVSAANTITFDGGTGNAATRILTFAATSQSESHTFRIENTPWVRLYNLTIRGTGATYAWPVHLLGNATSNIHVKNCLINFTGGNGVNGTSDNFTGIVVNNSTTTVNGNTTLTDIEIDSNTIEGGNNGIYMYMQNSNNINIRYNRILNANQYGINFYYASAFRCNYNTINMRPTGPTTSMGIYANFPINSGTYAKEIIGNAITDAGQYGINIYYMQAATNMRSKVINNMIGGTFRSTDPAGIYINQNVSNADIWFNSVNLDNAATGAQSAAMKIISNNSGLDIRNNNFAVANAASTAFALFCDNATSFNALDYNNYYKTGNPSRLLGFGTSVYGPANFKGALGYNASAVNISPGYLTAKNLGTVLTCNNGVTIPSVTTDIEGHTRNTPPDIGCDENITSQPIDLSLQQVSSPQIPLSIGTSNIRVVIRNNGTTTITSANVNYNVNGSALQTINWTGSLAPCDSATVEFNATSGPGSTDQRFTFLPGVSYSLLAFTSQPNGTADLLTANDSLILGPVCASLSGNFIIDSAATPSANTFNSFTSAVSALACGGISGPVVFDVQQGTYIGQIDIPAINGASAVNTITFDGGAGNASTRIISWASTATNSLHTLRLNNSQFITLRNLTIRATGASFGWPLHLFNNCSNTKIKNCRIEFTGNGLNGTTDNYAGIVMNNWSASASPTTSSTNAINVEIDSNYILGGNSSVYLVGNGSNTGIFFRNNTLDSSSTYGVYASSLVGPKMNDNTLNMRSNGSASGYGLYFTSVSSTATAFTEVNRNKIYDAGQYGIYLSSTSGFATNRAQMINNSIGGGFRNASPYGIFFTSSSNWNVWFNSVNINNAATGSTAAMLIQSTSTLNDVRNNNLAITNPSAGINMFALRSASGCTFTSLNYNNYYRPANTNNLINVNGTNYDTLTYNTATSGGLNSLRNDPGYVGVRNLDVSVATNNGVFLPQVTTDINNNTRNNPPDIGAYETASGLLTDLGIIAVSSPDTSLSSGLRDVVVTVKNFGTGNITSFNLRHTVNGANLQDSAFTGLALATNDTLRVTLSGSKRANLVAASINTFRVYLHQPNGSNDNNLINDTIIIGPKNSALNGVYTINPSGSGSSNFTSFRAAVSALNSGGVSGPVTFNVLPATYTEQVNLIAVNGASATNTISFVGSNTAGCIVDTAANNTSNYHTIRLNGASYVTLRNLTIRASGATAGCALQITGSSNYSKVKNCSVEISGAAASSTSSNFIALLVSNATSIGSPGVNTQYVLGLEIDSNTILNGYYGLYVNGRNGTPYSGGNFFRRNQILNAYYWGFSVSYHEGLVFNNNTINMRTTGSPNAYGIYVSQCNNNISTSFHTINSNTILNSGNYGIYITSSGSGTLKNQLYNNMIAGGFRIASSYGMYLTSINNFDILHNSVNLDFSTNNIQYAAFFLSGGSNLDVRNNVFAHTGATGSIGVPAYFSGIPGGQFRFDYNNYYKTSTTNTNLIYLAGSIYTTANYQGGLGYNTNAISKNPQFVSGSDLHIGDGCSNGVNTGLVLNDIDGNVRSITPDIGCDEYNGSNNDIGVSAISPFGSGLQNVRVTIRNYGVNNITSALVSYSVNGSVPRVVTFSGNLAPCDTTTIIFSGANQFNFVSGVSYSVVAYTSGPNASADPRLSNDTFTFGPSCVFLNGVYTINASGSGSNNFTSFTEAVNALNCGGISGPVVFNVSPGTYNEQVQINNITGSSVTNTITFNGDSAANRILTYSPTVNTAAHTIRLNGAGNIMLRNLTVQTTGASFGSAIHMFGSVSNIKVRNCIVEVSGVGATSANGSYMPVVINNGNDIYNPTSSGSQFTNIEIDSNIIRNGYYGVVQYGTFNTPYSLNLTMRRNRIDSVHTYGTYFLYVDALTFLDNTINMRIMGNVNSAGLYAQASFCSGSNIHRISGNRIINAGQYGINLSQVYNSSSLYRSIASNNMIGGGFRSTAACGIIFSNQNYWDVWNNSINLDIPTNSSQNASLFIQSSNSIDIRNNIIMQSATSGSGIPLNITTTGAIAALNNNNYANNAGTSLIAVAATTYTTANYINGGGYNANSRNDNPGFVSSKDLHITSGCLNGTPIAAVTTDIDGQTRNTPPDMGADEFTGGVNNDIGISSLQVPATPFTQGLLDIRVVLNNYGVNAITGATVKYRINGGTPFTLTYSGNLGSCDTTSMLFTGANRFNFVLGNSYLLQAWSEQPNSVTDANKNNDTLTLTICPALNGNYTINPSGSGPTNFTSFTAAGSALSCGGINGPVTFTVSPGTYNEQFTLINVPGLSASNTLTIDGVDAATRTITFAPTLSTAGHTIRIQNSPYVAIRNLTVVSAGASFGAAVHIVGNSHFTSVKKCVIRFNGAGQTSGGSGFTGVLVNNNPDVNQPTTNGGAVNNLEIDSNRITFGYYGICVTGITSTPYANNIKIRANTIDSAFYYGTYIYYIDGARFNGNTISMRITGSINSSGLYFSQCYTSGSNFHEIIGNRIVQTGQTGVYCYFSSNPSGIRGLFANNAIGGGFRSSNSYGVYWQYSDNWDIWNNSVNLDIATTSNQYAAINLYHFTTYNVDIRNNHFVYSAASGTGIPLYLSGTNTLTALDYNNYFNNASTNLLFRNSTTYTSANYQTLAGGGANARNANPAFASSMNLRNGGCIKGVAIAGITNDMDGTVRNSPPDMGAYESRNNDAGVVGIAAPIPPVSPGLQNVGVVIKNFGANVINTLSVSYDVNGAGAVTQNLSALNLQPCSTTIVTFTGPQQFNFTPGSANINAYTASPNGNTDPNKQNDTVKVSLCGPLSGNYTINPSGSGASNFTSFGSALAAMQCAGITGPVVFNIAAATYNEQVDIAAIPGANATNTVTFDGGTGNAATRILTFSASVNNLRHTLRFNNCQYVTVRNITIQTTGTNLGWGVHYFGNAHNNTVNNCKIEIAGTNGAISTSNNFIGIVGSASATSEYTGGQILNAIIDSNTVTNGYYSVIFNGLSGFPCLGLTARGNSFMSSYYYGIYMNYVDSTFILNNTITNRMGASGTANAYGIYLTNSNSGAGKWIDISGNKLYDIASYGIQVNSSSNSALRNRLWNNMIGGGFISSNAQGISFNSSNNWDVFHNTVNLDAATSNNSASALYIAFGSNMSVKNNILTYTATSGSGLPFYNVVNTSFGSSAQFNYNIFYKYGVTNNGNLIYNGGNYTPLNVIGGNGSNLNSFVINPQFAGNKDLHISDGCYNGDSLGVTVDIDGNTRASFADIGADEVPSGNDNIGVKALLSPAIPLTPGLQDIRVIVKNYGANPVYNGTVKYSVNGGTPVSLIFNDTLTPCDTAIVTFTGANQFNFIGGNVYSIKVYTELPNGNPDTYTNNDSLSTGSLCTGLTGVFTIDPAGSGSTNYTSFAAAISALQCSGVTGPVTFNVAAGTYTNQVVIPAIAGASFTNQVIFNGAGSANTIVTFAATTTADGHTIKMQGSGFVQLQNMTIRGTSSVKAWPLHIMSSANVKVKNCLIEITGTGAAGASNLYMPVVINGSATSATTQAVVDSIDIDSCVINGGYAGIWTYNSNGANNRYRWNTINNPSYYGLYLYNTAEVKAIGNTLNMAPNGNINSVGMYFYSCSANGTMTHQINNNKIFDMGQYGMYFYFSSGSFSNPSTISNNMITGFRNTTSHYGMMMEYANYWGVWFNTIHSDTATSSMNGVLHLVNSGQNDVRNNILSVASASSAQIPLYAATGGNVSQLNYNNYYKPGSANPLIFVGANFNSSTFVGGAGFNQNSFSRDPLYTTRRNLHINNSCNNGVQIAAITTDIDGNTRVNPPDVGADEVTGGVTDNAGVTAILSPSSPLIPGVQDIQVVISNLGSNMIVGCNAHYKINNAAAVNLIVTDTIMPCDTQLVTFTGANQYNFAPGTAYTIKSYSSLPNGVADNNAVDDTTTLGPLCPAMNGNYTIDPAGSGPNNFVSFNAAVSALQCAGINGNVIFTVANGTFNEQVNIGAINGTTDSTRVLFTGTSQAGTILTFNAISPTATHTLRINNSQYISFSNMTIQSGGTTFGVPVHIMGSSNYTRVKNCIIRITGTGAGSANTGYVPVLINNTSDINNAINTTFGSFINHIEIDSNRIFAGYYSVVINGRSASPYCSNLRFRRNMMDSAYYYGLYASYTDAMKFQNNQVHIRVNGTTGSYGLYLNYCVSTGTNQTEISSNRVSGAGQYGIYSWFSSSAFTGRGRLVNNMIGGPFRTSGAIAFSWNYSDYWDIWNNTMVLDFATSSANNAAAFLQHFSGTYNLDIRNNNFYYSPTTGNGMPFYATGSTSFTAFNFNNFYRPTGTNLVYINGTTYTNTTYQGGGGYNAASSSTSNSFVSVRDLHITAAGAKGQAIAQVTTDIDGEARQTTPDIGADEYFSSMDIGVSSIDTPLASTFCSGNKEISVRIRNYGNQAITSATVHVAVNGVVMLTYPWTGSLGLSATSAPFIVGTVNIGAGNPVVTAFTSAPNGGIDISAANDSASRTFTVNQTVSPTLSISASDTAICSGTTVTLVASYTNGGSTPLIQWRKNGITMGTTDTIITNALANNDSLICILSSSATCANPSSVISNYIKMNVNTTQPAQVSITANTTTICTGQNVRFAATSVNGGITPSYQWKLNGVNVGTDTSVYQSTTLNNNDSVTVILTSSLACASPNKDTSNFIKVTVNSFVTPAVSIVATATSICSGVVDTFTATPVNGGASPTYQWKRNGVNVGTNSNRFITTTLANNDSIEVVMTSNAVCASPTSATSNKIGVNVTPSVTPTNVVNATATTICSGTQVTFISAITNGGTTPHYQWKKNNVDVGTDTNVYADNNLQNNDSIYVVLTSNAPCATATLVNSNKMKLTVNPLVTPDVSIAGSANNICSGTSVQFTATPVNGGATPSYQWKRNGVNVGTDSTRLTSSSFSNGDTIRVVLTSNVACATKTTDTSNFVVMQVTPSVTPTISASSAVTTICAGTPVTFSALGTNGGISPAYQWKRNGSNVGADSTGFTTSTINNNDTFYVVYTSSAACATVNNIVSNKIIMRVNNIVPVTVNITATGTSICSGSPVTFSANYTNGGFTPSFQWRKNGVTVGTDSMAFTTTALSNGDSIRVTYISSATCPSAATLPSNTIVMSVTPSVTPDINIAASAASICIGQGVTFTATPLNAGTAPVYKWIKNGVQTGTDSTGLTTTSLASSDVFRCILTSNAACATKTSDTSNAVSINVKPLPVKPVITRNSDSLTSTAALSYQWFRDGNIISGATTRKIKITQNGTYTVAVDSNGCPNISSGFLVNNVGMDNLGSIGSISVYPNPTNSGITLNVIFTEKAATTISVVDMFGKVAQRVDAGEVSEIKDEMLNLQDLADGIYFIQVTHGNNAAVKKVIKAAR